jgi:hypothetical protein
MRSSCCLWVCVSPYSESLYDWRFTAKHFVLAPSLLRPMTRVIFFLQLNPYGHNPCVTSSRQRGWVCLLWIHLGFVMCTRRTSSSIYKSSVSPDFPQSRLYFSYFIPPPQFLKTGSFPVGHIAEKTPPPTV